MYILIDENNIVTETCSKSLGVENEIKIDIENLPECEHFDHWEYQNGEIIAVPIPQEQLSQQEIMKQVANLKAQLKATDYVVIKIAEGVATPEEYAEVIAQRQQWREKINELENQNG